MMWLSVRELRAGHNGIMNTSSVITGGMGEYVDGGCVMRIYEFFSHCFSFICNVGRKDIAENENRAREG